MAGRKKMNHDKSAGRSARLLNHDFARACLEQPGFKASTQAACPPVEYAFMKALDNEILPQLPATVSKSGAGFQ